MQRRGKIKDGWGDGDDKMREIVARFWFLLIYHYATLIVVVFSGFLLVVR